MTILRRSGLSLTLGQRYFSSIRGFQEIPSLTLLDIVKFINPYNEKHLKSTFESFFRQHGNIIKTRLPGTKYDIVYICDPEDGQELLKNDGQFPIITGFDFFVTYRNKIRGDQYRVSKGLVGSHGEAWHEVRSSVQQDMMRPQSAMFYIPHIEQISHDVTRLVTTARREDHTVQDVVEIMFRWALESITSVFLDTRMGCLEEEPAEETRRMISNATIMLGPDMWKLLSRPPVWKYFKVPYFQRVDGAATEILQICSKYIKEAARRIEEEKATRQESNGRSILEKLLERCGDKTEIPTVMAMDAMLAGVDTTGVSATFLLYLLAVNQDKQELLYREIQEVVGEGEVTVAGLKRMKYLRACSQESHRLLPVINGASRRTQKDLVLSNYRVPTGTCVIYWTFMCARSECQYEQPQRFLPERWLRGHEDYQQAHAFSHIPFGHGPRSCIGRRFAEMEVSVLVIKILQHFRLEYEGPPLGLIMAITNKPDRPVNIKFKDRKSL